MQVELRLSANYEFIECIKVQLLTTNRSFWRLVTRPGDEIGRKV